MEPRLTRGEYWILSAAVVDRMPLGRLTVSNIEEAFNRPGHGLSFDAVAETVRRLLEQRLICAGMYATSHDATVWSEVALDAEAVGAAVRERVVSGGPYYRTHYGLTDAGAAAWEAFARPDWSQFIDTSMDIETRTSTTLCQSERSLRDYCDASSTWLLIDRGSFALDRVEPWQATYWKSLPFAHRARGVEADPNIRTSCAEGAMRYTALRAMTWIQHRWCNRWL